MFQICYVTTIPHLNKIYNPFLMERMAGLYCYKTLFVSVNLYSQIFSNKMETVIMLENWKKSAINSRMKGRMRRVLVFIVVIRLELY